MNGRTELAGNRVLFVTTNSAIDSIILDDEPKGILLAIVSRREEAYLCPVNAVRATTPHVSRSFPLAAACSSSARVETFLKHCPGIIS